jgi:acetylornithine/succinyldiaminopimelate/putrescine aminotransferase
MLTRWDPFREMMSIRNTMDRMFDSAMSGSPDRWQPMAWDLALDVVENKDEFVVKASVPGINPDDLEISFTNNTLTVRGEIKEEKEVEEAHYHLRERRYGSLARSLTLPAGIEDSKIEENSEAGVLKMRLPKAEEVKPKKITVVAKKKPLPSNKKEEDKTGKKYIDLVSGISVSNTGHRHPKVIKAIMDQCTKYLHLNVYGEFIQAPQVILAQLLASLLPGQLQSVYFVNSGSEAIEGAMKLSKRFTGRSEIIAFHNAYHGSTQGALSILGNESLKNEFRPLLPETRFLHFNDFSCLEQITSKTACVVCETIQAEAGIILPVAGYLEALRERCTDMGALLVVDDVQMGMGRTGKMFSFEHFGFVPDILVLAKALGGGLPLGAFISSPAIMSSLAIDPELGHITTFGGHPLSCAAAIANLRVIIDEKLTDDADRKGSGFRMALNGHPAIMGIRQKGLVLGVDLSNPLQRTKFSTAALQNGLIIDWFLFSPATFRIAPPLTITDEESELSCSLLLQSLNQI